MTDEATDRPALYRVTKGTPKGASAAIVESDGKTALVRRINGGEPFTKRLDSLERIFRTPQEKELGREFPPEEAAADSRRLQHRYAALMENRSRVAILEGIEGIAQRLERAAVDLRRILETGSDPAEKAMHVQQELAGSFRTSEATG